VSCSSPAWSGQTPVPMYKQRQRWETAWLFVREIDSCMPIRNSYVVQSRTKETCTMWTEVLHRCLRRICEITNTRKVTNSNFGRVWILYTDRHLLFLQRFKYSKYPCLWTQRISALDDLLRHCKVLHFPLLWFWSVIFRSCILRPCHLVRLCQVLYFQSTQSSMHHPS